MPTKLGHGLRRRGRRAGAKRRTPRAAIAAGALAAASIPLWPSPAGAGFFDEFKRETHMENGCPITVESYRLGSHLWASTSFGSGSACLALLQGVRDLMISVEYVNVGSDTVRTSTVTGAARSDGAHLSMTIDFGVRDLVRSSHYHGEFADGGCICTGYTLNHPKQAGADGWTDDGEPPPQLPQAQGSYRTLASGGVLFLEQVTIRVVDDAWLSVQEAAVRCAMSYRTMLAKVRRGQLPAEKPDGKPYRLRRADVDAFNRAVEGAAG